MMSAMPSNNKMVEQMPHRFASFVVFGTVFFPHSPAATHRLDPHTQSAHASRPRAQAPRSRSER
jgi:hypothetical protein